MYVKKLEEVPLAHTHTGHTRICYTGSTYWCIDLSIARRKMYYSTTVQPPREYSLNSHARHSRRHWLNPGIIWSQSRLISMYASVRQVLLLLDYFKSVLLRYAKITHSLTSFIPFTTHSTHARMWCEWLNDFFAASAAACNWILFAIKNCVFNIKKTMYYAHSAHVPVVV